MHKLALPLLLVMMSSACSKPLVIEPAASRKPIVSRSLMQPAESPPARQRWLDSSSKLQTLELQLIETYRRMTRPPSATP